MGARVLIDTNILVYVFSQELSQTLSDRLSVFFRESFVISVINKIEFLGWKDATEEEYQQASDFLANADVLTIDDPVIKKTIALKRQKKLKLPDAIIAATCLTHNLILLTRNVKDFVNIEGLTVSNPFDNE